MEHVVQGFAHATIMELDSLEHFDAYLSEVATMTTDLGVEAGLQDFRFTSYSEVWDFSTFLPPAQRLGQSALNNVRPEGAHPQTNQQTTSKMNSSLFRERERGLALV